MVTRPDMNPSFVRDASRSELDRLRERRTALAKDLKRVCADIAWRESLLALSSEDGDEGKEAGL